MRLLSWNCRGLGGPFTVSQLKESVRLNLPDMIFLCESKQYKGFIGTVCKRLKFGNKWEVREPIGRKGGMMVAWTSNVEVKQLRISDFRIEMLLTIAAEGLELWIIWVYASTEEHERKNQWEFLKG